MLEQVFFSMQKEAPKRNGNRSMTIRPTDDGLHVDGSILWLDSKANGDLSFLSSAEQARSFEVPQVIATEETLKLIENKRRKLNALVCQYNRPFSIGKLKMELLPSGSMLGGASLYVEADKKRILYAPQLQSHKTNVVRQMQLKKAHTLVIGAFHPDPNTPLPNRKKERDRLLTTVKKYLEQGIFPIIQCKIYSTAQELTKFLSENDIPLAVHNTIYKVNRIYEAYGSQLGEYTLFSPRHTKNKVLIFPLPIRHKGLHLRRPIPDGPLLVVEDTLDRSNNSPSFRDIDDRFFISSTCDGKEIREVIAAVNPKEVYVFGPYAKSYANELKGICKDIKPLFSNDQPTLF